MDLQKSSRTFCTLEESALSDRYAEALTDQQSIDGNNQLQTNYAYETMVKVSVKDHFTAIEDRLDRLKDILKETRTTIKLTRIDMISLEGQHKEDCSRLKDFVMNEISRLDRDLQNIKTETKEESLSLSQQVNQLNSEKRKLQQGYIVANLTAEELIKNSKLNNGICFLGRFSSCNFFKEKNSVILL